MVEVEMKNYFGCTIKHNWAERTLRMTQLVLIKSFEDELENQKTVSILMKHDPKWKLMSE